MQLDIVETLKEVAQSVLPLALIVIVLLAFVVDAPVGRFTVSTILVIGGIAIFLIGVKVGILPFGEQVGGSLPQSGSLRFVVLVAFLLGFVATVAEPDVRILSDQVDAVSGGTVPKAALVGAISLGIGIFLVVSMLRIVYNVPISYLFFAGYGCIIALSFFTPSSFVPISFDAGGVTTGPMTVPVILSLGVGMVSVLSGKSALSDGFGFIGLASMGPIISVMLMGAVFY